MDQSHSLIGSPPIRQPIRDDFTQTMPITTHISCDLTNQLPDKTLQVNKIIHTRKILILKNSIYILQGF